MSDTELADEVARVRVELLGLLKSGKDKKRAEQLRERLVEIRDEHPSAWARADAIRRGQDPDVGTT